MAGASRRTSAPPRHGIERAAKQGLAPAQFRLGGFYEKGIGVKKDLDAARRFYELAGEAGNAKALHNLAVLYAEGMDGKPDYQAAAQWFRKAAAYGMADSQYNLGVLYARGIGVEQDLVEAYRWFGLAARGGDRESERKRDELASRIDQQFAEIRHAGDRGLQARLAARGRHAGQGSDRRLGAGCGSRERAGRRQAPQFYAGRPAGSREQARPGNDPATALIDSRGRRDAPPARPSPCSRDVAFRSGADARQIAARPQIIDHGPCLWWPSALEWFYLPLGSCPNSRGVA